MAKTTDKSLESWIWDAACSIRGAKDAPKYKDYILPLIFTKRLCDVFDDELNRIAREVGSRKKAFQLARRDKKLVRFCLPLVPDDPEQPVWSVIRKLSDKIGEGVTTHMRAIARENPLLQGIIDRVDFNATTHGQRDLDDDRLRTFDRVVANPMWNQDWFTEADYDADELGRFPPGFPGKSSADWGWVQHMHASLKSESDGRAGRAAVVLDTGAASRGSGNAGANKEKTVRQWFVDRDLIEAVLYLPENLFYNTTAPGIVLFLNKAKPIMAQCLFHLHFMEKRGSGFRRIQGWMEAAGLDRHRLREEDGYLELVLPGPGDDLGRLQIPPSKLGAVLPQNLTAQLNARQQKMAELLASGETLTSRFCEEQFRVSRQTSSADFALLMTLKIATRIGRGRSTAYAFFDGK